MDYLRIISALKGSCWIFKRFFRLLKDSIEFLKDLFELFPSLKDSVGFLKDLFGPSPFPKDSFGSKRILLDL